MGEYETPFLDQENPWPGLMHFTEGTSAFFHGREAEVGELARRVHREILTVFFGQSGLGKTSLLSAGLFPRLRAADFLPIYLRLDFASTLSLVDQIRSALSDNLARYKIEAPLPRADQTLWGYFHEKDCEFWSPRNRLITPVLVFDQFEEIFTLGARARSQGKMIEELAALVENRAPESVRREIETDPDLAERYDFSIENCKIVLALREDFFARLRGTAKSDALTDVQSDAFDAHEWSAGARCYP